MIIGINVFSQEKDKKYYLNGYLSQMNQMIIDSIDGNWVNDGLIHNRLMFNYYGIKNLTFDLEVRNRVFYGETVKYTPNYGDYVGADRGFVDLSFNLVEEPSFVINTAIDRLYFQYEIGKFKATIGRQRINWGATFVWNPNDLFNNYSFFDFDYAEKPGADAVYLQYFRNFASSLELAAKINADTALTVAMKYGFNALGYDFQVIGGMLDDNDVVAGVGWSGYISQLTFRGEGSYIHPIDNFVDTSGILLAAVGLDYMFPNSLTIMGEFLYNSAAQGLNISNIYQIQSAPMNVKNLSFSKYSVVLQVSYPINPLINVSLAAMYMDANNMMFFSPNIGFSISQNVDFSFVAQVFTGEITNPITQKQQHLVMSLLFARLKYSF